MNDVYHTSGDVSDHASLEQIWAWLEEVPDPEIPVLSVLDLGMVRDIKRDDGCLTVTITPTYSGCPATNTIAMDIEAALVRKGERRRFYASGGDIFGKWWG